MWCGYSTLGNSSYRFSIKFLYVLLSFFCGVGWATQQDSSVPQGSVRGDDSGVFFNQYSYDRTKNSNCLNSNHHKAKSKISKKFTLRSKSINENKKNKQTLDAKPVDLKQEKNQQQDELNVQFVEDKRAAVQIKKEAVQEKNFLRSACEGMLKGLARLGQMGAKRVRAINRIYVTDNPYEDAPLSHLAVIDNSYFEDGVIIDKKELGVKCSSRCTLVRIPETERARANSCYLCGDYYLKLVFTNRYGQICISLNKNMVSSLKEESLLFTLLFRQLKFDNTIENKKEASCPTKNNVLVVDAEVITAFPLVDQRVLIALAKTNKQPLYVSREINNAIAVALSTMDHFDVHNSADVVFSHTTVVDIPTVLNCKKALFGDNYWNSSIEESQELPCYNLYDPEENKFYRNEVDVNISSSTVDSSECSGGVVFVGDQFSEVQNITAIKEPENCKPSTLELKNGYLSYKGYSGGEYYYTLDTKLALDYEEKWKLEHQMHKRGLFSIPSLYLNFACTVKVVTAVMLAYPALTGVLLSCFFPRVAVAMTGSVNEEGNAQSRSVRDIFLTRDKAVSLIKPRKDSFGITYDALSDEVLEYRIQNHEEIYETDHVLMPQYTTSIVTKRPIERMEAPVDDRIFQKALIRNFQTKFVNNTAGTPPEIREWPTHFTVAYGHNTGSGDGDRMYKGGTVPVSDYLFKVFFPYKDAGTKKDYFDSFYYTDHDKERARACNLKYAMGDSSQVHRLPPTGRWLADTTLQQDGWKRNISDKNWVTKYIDHILGYQALAREVKKDEKSMGEMWATRSTTSPINTQLKTCIAATKAPVLTTFAAPAVYCSPEAYSGCLCWYAHHPEHGELTAFVMSERHRNTDSEFRAAAYDERKSQDRSNLLRRQGVVDGSFSNVRDTIEENIHSSCVSGRLWKLARPATARLFCGSFHDHLNQRDYGGEVSTTVTGKTCQAWDKQFPHPHNLPQRDLPYRADDSFRLPQSYSLLGTPNNVCRNPDNMEKGVWCYTTDPNTRWEYCTVPVCSTEPPKETETTLGCGSRDKNQRDYMGRANVTRSGRTCQSWQEQWPQVHSEPHDSYTDLDIADGVAMTMNGRNYCRNPDNKPRVWCYTTDRSKRWEFCDVPFCDTEPRTSKTTAKASTHGMTTRSTSRSTTKDTTTATTTAKANIGTAPAPKMGSTAVTEKSVDYYNDVIAVCNIIIQYYRGQIKVVKKVIANSENEVFRSTGRRTIQSYEQIIIEILEKMKLSEDKVNSLYSVRGKTYNLSSQLIAELSTEFMTAFTTESTTEPATETTTTADPRKKVEERIRGFSDKITKEKRENAEMQKQIEVYLDTIANHPKNKGMKVFYHNVIKVFKRKIKKNNKNIAFLANKIDALQSRHRIRHSKRGGYVRQEKQTERHMP